MELDIELEGINNKVITNLAKRLQGKFRPDSQNDISDAVVLSCYMYFSGNPRQAISLLESFLYFNYDDKPESKRDLWVDNTEGILLLSYIQKCEGIKPVDLNLEYILGKDSQVNPTKFMVEDLRYSLKANSKYLELAKSETPKFQCQTYAQQVLKFISLMLLWPYYAGKVVRVGFKLVTISTINETLDKNIELLKVAMDAAANK